MGSFFAKRASASSHAVASKTHLYMLIAGRSIAFEPEMLLNCPWSVPLTIARIRFLRNNRFIAVRNTVVTTAPGTLSVSQSVLSSVFNYTGALVRMRMHTVVHHLPYQAFRHATTEARRIETLWSLYYTI